MSSVTAVPIQPVKRRYIVYLVLGLVLAVIAAAALAMQAPGDPAASFLAKNARDKGVVTTASGLQYKVLTPGAGAKPTDTDVALINYVGKLPDGSIFDQSQQPTPMPVAGVVPGFSEALKLMPKGAKYRVWIKPELGYGSPRPDGAPPLDPKAAELATKVLAFDIELLDFLPEAVIRQMQQQQMMQQGAPGAPPPRRDAAALMADTIEAPAPLPTPAKPAPKAGRRSFWIGVLVGALVMAAVLTAVSAFRGSTLATSAFLLKNKHAAGVVETGSGLQYQVIAPGKGAKPTDSDVVLVNYEGKLLDGTVFDKSPQPTPFPVGAVVRGFSEGLKLMPKGSKYKFWIKPELGYGDKASGLIPANSVLVFEVELVDFLPEAVIRQMQAAQAGATGQPR